nr:hypothetical protein CFP56_17078 [Quercus suber]
MMKRSLMRNDIRENILAGLVLRPPIKNCHVENTKFTLKPLSKQTPNRTKKENQPSDKSSHLHLYFLHAEPPPPPHRLLEQNDFEEERVLAVPSTSFSGVVPSFACPNLHHTTHWSSPPQSSPELCVELGNKSEPP